MASNTVTTRRGLPGPLATLEPLHWIGILLAASTGAIHLWLGMSGTKAGMLVAGVGFAVGAAAVLLDVHRAMFVRLGIPFTAGQILLYALAHGLFRPDAPSFGPVGLFDKVVQGLLVVVLVGLVRRP